MTKFEFVTAILFISIIGFAVPQAFALTYKDKLFTIDYPEGWKVQVRSGDNLMWPKYTEYVKFGDVLPDYNAKIVVTHWPDMLAGYNLKDYDYLQSSLNGNREFCEKATFDNIGRLCTNYKVLESKRIKHNDFDVIQIRQSFTLTYEGYPSTDWKSFSHDYYIGTDYWSIYSEARVDVHDKYIDKIESSIKSFKFDEKYIEEKTKKKIPDWVRSIFIWYGEGAISEDEVINAIKFLISKRIIQLE